MTYMFKHITYDDTHTHHAWFVYSFFSFKHRQNKTRFDHFYTIYRAIFFQLKYYTKIKYKCQFFLYTTL